MAVYFKENARESVIEAIAGACYTLVNGDDVEYEGGDEEVLEEMESELGYSVDDLSEIEFVEQLSDKEIYSIYCYLRESGNLNEIGEI